MKIELNITGLDALASSIESLAKAMTANKPDSVSEKMADLEAVAKLLENDKPIGTIKAMTVTEPEKVEPPAPVETPKPAKKKKPAPKKEKVVEPVVEPEPEIVTEANNEQAKLDLIVLTKGAMSEATKAGEQEAARVALKSAYAVVDVPNVTKCPLDKVESLAHEITQLLASWIK